MMKKDDMGKHNPYCKQKQQNNINVSESAISVLQCECLINNITIIIVHQIFSLACDWSKRVMWANIPQLKLGNIRGYSPIFKTDG